MLQTESSEDYTPSSQLDELLNSLDRVTGYEEEGRKPFEQWVEGIILDGNPFAYAGHEYLRVPYADPHPWVVEEKAAQLGLTSKAMLRVSYGCRYGNYRGILYLFPSKTDVTEFSKGRITPLIEDNPDTIGAWIKGIKGADSANIKLIWNSIVYFRGMQSRIGLKGIPADMIVFDELDEAPPKRVDMAMKRMNHSEFKHVMMLSNPTLPDYGINKEFQRTDQRYWLLKCPKCNHYTCMEDTFPDCLLELKSGEVIRACTRCHGKLDPAEGEWVAKKPRVEDRRGYHYSQLFANDRYVDLAEVLRDFRTTNNLTDFHNLTIGNAYVEAENRLSIQEILDLCSLDGIQANDPGPCYMGVDQGSDLHAVIGKKHPSAAGKIIHLGVYKDWEELDGLMKNFRVQLCVVDGLPETRNARDFAGRHNTDSKHRVYLNYYNIHQKGSYAWNERDHIVSCNRTESLDASHKEVQGNAIVIPRHCDIVQTFAEHLHNVAKKLEEDEETGAKRYNYLKLGEDHFRHAFNYEAMARQNAPDLLFPEYA